MVTSKEKFCLYTFCFLLVTIFYNILISIISLFLIEIVLNKTERTLLTLAIFSLTLFPFKYLLYSSLPIVYDFLCRNSYISSTLLLEIIPLPNLVNISFFIELKTLVFFTILYRLLSFNSEYSFFQQPSSFNSILDLFIKSKAYFSLSVLLTPSLF